MGAKLTIEAFYEGEELPARPGNEYEIAEGVYGRLRHPTVGLLDSFVQLEVEEAQDDKERESPEFQKKYRDMIVAQCELILVVPKNFKMEDGLWPVLQRVRTDFLRTLYPSANGLKRSSEATDEA